MSNDAHDHNEDEETELWLPPLRSIAHAFRGRTESTKSLILYLAGDLRKPLHQLEFCMGRSPSHLRPIPIRGGVIYPYDGDSIWLDTVMGALYVASSDELAEGRYSLWRGRPLSTVPIAEYSSSVAVRRVRSTKGRLLHVELHGMPDDD